MNQDRLAVLIERPETHRMILGGYGGSYSLGLGLSQQNPNELVIKVRIEGEDAGEIPPHVTLDGETIPIVVQTNFKAPVPLNRS